MLNFFDVRKSVFGIKIDHLTDNVGFKGALACQVLYNILNLLMIVITNDEL